MEVLKLKAELIKLEIENILNVDDPVDSAGNASLIDVINNSQQEGKQSYLLQSIGSLVSENKNLKKTIIELSKSNDEHIDNNKFLKNKLESSNTLVTNPSFAQVMTSLPAPKVDASVPAIIIQGGKNINKEQLLIKTKKILSNKTKVQLDKIFCANNKTIVKCHKQSDVDSTVQCLSELDNNEAVVNIEKKFNPRLKVVNVDYYFGAKDNQLIAKDMIERNYLAEENSLVIINKYSNNNKTWSIIIEVDSINYAKIMDSKKIYVGPNRCTVYDNVHIKMCNKCSCFGHNGDKYRSNDVRCCHCAEDHKSEDCTNKDIKKCCNCIYFNKKFNQNIATDHKAEDRAQCQSFQRFYKSYISKIDYPANFKPGINT